MFRNLMMKDARVTSQIDGLLQFLAESVTPFHAVAAMSKRLIEAGFEELSQFHFKNLTSGRGYFATKQGSSLIALRVGAGDPSKGLRLVGAHTDSPNLSVKPNPVRFSSGCVQLGVDVYGGALLNPWFDRDLSMAGRVSFLSPSGIIDSTLFDTKRPVAVIPSLAIHLDREANKQRTINYQKHIVPIIMLSEKSSFDIREWLTKQLRDVEDIECAEVLDYELSLYDSHAPNLIGLRNEFIASARLDNLISCYTGMLALIEASNSEWSMLVTNDHEEVGSASSIGAQGPMLTDALAAIAPELKVNQDMRSTSWMISVDNAHAIHPNYPERHDDQHSPTLGGGPVIKINRNQRYATSGDGAARVRLLARRAEVKVQPFVMRSDLACGSTIGPIIATETGIDTTDVGVPTLGMHSIRELASVEDIPALLSLLTAFYQRLV